MVQNYRYLNKWTIKNNYPLPLISDIIENIGTKKMFTKLDLQWEYNNVQIKEGDEQKVVFTILEGLFESIVNMMFSSLINSPVTFQMMNKILQDSINTGEVASFINSVIIEMEKEKKHNEIIEEVVKMLAENNLYVKPEKYKQKVRKVGFYRVVIGPEGIKIEEEKVKAVL